jgi:hypothetical protein
MIPELIETTDFWAALLGAVVGGVIAVVASVIEIRAAKASRRSDYRTDAYLAFMEWVAEKRRGVEVGEDTRDTREWDAGPLETRAYAFGSDAIRDAMVRVMNLRDAYWWYEDGQARRVTAELVNQIRVAMEHELRNESYSLKSSLDAMEKVRKELRARHGRAIPPD